MPPRDREPWTSEDIETLRKLAGEGADLSTIARRLERRREAVAVRAFRANIEIGG